MLEFGKVVDYLSNEELLIHSGLRMMSTTFLPRDFLVLQSYDIDGDDATIVSTSVKDEIVPHVVFGVYIRGDVNFAGWLLERDGDDVAVTYIEDVNLHGVPLYPIIQQFYKNLKPIPRVAPLLEYMKTARGVPFVVRGPVERLGPTSNITIQQELNSVQYNLKLCVILETANDGSELRASRTEGAVHVAIPATVEYLQGVEIGVQFDPAIFTAKAEKVVDREWELDGIISKRTHCVVKLTISADAETLEEYSRHQPQFIDFTKNRTACRRGSVVGSPEWSAPVTSVVGYAHFKIQPHQGDSINLMPGLIQLFDYTPRIENQNSEFHPQVLTIVPPAETLVVPPTESQPCEISQLVQSTAESQPAVTSLVQSAATTVDASAPAQSEEEEQSRADSAIEVKTSPANIESVFPAPIQAVMNVVDPIWDKSVDATADVIIGGVNTLRSLFGYRKIGQGKVKPVVDAAAVVSETPEINDGVASIKKMEKKDEVDGIEGGEKEDDAVEKFEDGKFEVNEETEGENSEGQEGHEGQELEGEDLKGNEVEEEVENITTSHAGRESVVASTGATEKSAMTE
ncbi:hypothetical protein HDU76_009879, partial [Blyttiomyces sp. JEL0837]